MLSVSQLKTFHNVSNLEYTLLYTMIDLVQGGIFYYRPINPRIQQHVNDWMRCAAHIYRPFPSILVYRSMHSLDICPSHVFKHHLPISTTLCLKFAHDWLYQTQKQTILIFSVENIKCMYIDSVEEELVIEPGTITVQKQIHIPFAKQSIKYFLCLYEKNTE